MQVRVSLTLAVVSSLFFVPPLGAQSLEVVAERKISATEGGFVGPIGPSDSFGCAAAVLGDLGGDGAVELAIGAFGDDDGAFNAGAVWILSLAAGGGVAAEQKIGATSGGFSGALSNGSAFGVALAVVGDLDGDGIPELAVGSPYALSQGQKGEVWILFLQPDGTVREEQRIAAGVGGFTGVLRDQDGFGVALGALGDLDGDGVSDLAVGATGDDGGGANHGAVWVLFLNADGTVRAQQKIGTGQGGFGGNLDSGDRFGEALASPGDLDGDGVSDLAVGAPGDVVQLGSRGSVWVLLLNADGTVRAQRRISRGLVWFRGCVANDDFGSALAAAGDLDGDGVGDLLVGADGDSDFGPAHGAVWALFLGTTGQVPALQKVNELAGAFGGHLDDIDLFGSALAVLGDLGGNGTLELAAGTRGDDDGFQQAGAVWVLSTRAGLGTTHCDGVTTNSVDCQGLLSVWGSADVADDDLTLAAIQLPLSPNTAYFLAGAGTSTFAPPGSAGPMCVGPGIKRLLPAGQTQFGAFQRTIGTGLFAPGSTWSFQCWHRDGAGPSNLTEAVRVTFD